MLKRTFSKSWFPWLTAGSMLLLGTIAALPLKAATETARSSVPLTLLAQNNIIRATSAQEETLYLNNDRRYSYNLIAAERGTIDGITIPVGATIVGYYEPAEGGLRYVAEAVVYDTYSYQISATSSVLEDKKDPRDTSAGAIAEDAGIGAAAGVVLGEVFGDADIGEVVGGAAAGAAVGNITADRVVVIEPDQPISLYD